MPRIKPIDEIEFDRKIRHACPRIKRWKNRFDEAEGNVHRLREQAINRSPVYVAIQRGSKNLQIRTKTSAQLWRKWIQQARKYGLEESPTPLHMPSDVYKIQRQVSVTTSTPKTERRSVPVSPVKSNLQSPVKVSYLRNDANLQTSRKIYPQKSVPKLTLTPVPLTQVLKKKARIVGSLASTFGKGKWIDQDPTMLVVPGSQPYQYDSSETEDEIEKKAGEILKGAMKHTPPSPTETIKKMAQLRRKESFISSPPKSPSKSPPKSPKKSPTKEPGEGEELPFDQEKIIRKIRAVGQTSVAFSPRRQREIIDEEEDEEISGRTSRLKSARINKIRAMGATRAALSPHLSPHRSPPRIEEPEQTEEEETVEEDKGTPMSHEAIKKKIKAVGATSAALSPKKIQDEDGIYDEDMLSPRRAMQQQFSESDVDPQTPSPSSTKSSLIRKMRFIGRFSLKGSPTSNASSISMKSIMSKIRILAKLSPNRDAINETQEEEKKDSDEDKLEKEVKESCFLRTYKLLCPCISKKNEPEPMEYQSTGSQNIY